MVFKLACLIMKGAINEANHGGRKSWSFSLVKGLEIMGSFSTSSSCLINSKTLETRELSKRVKGIGSVDS